MAAEALADAHARQGRAADDVALLEELAARDPLRESVAVQLVRALYAAGRQADALAAYDRCRGALADELGVEPTPALRQVRAAVLAHEPLPGVGGTVLPTHLPPRNRSFVGRRGLLAAVDATLDDDTRRPRAVALTGLGGVGQDRARAGAGPPAAPARPRRLVDLRRRPRRHRHRARRAGRRAGDRPVRAARGRPGGAVGRAGPHAGLAARLRQRGRARAARAVPARGPARRRDHHLAQPGLAAHRPPGRGRAAGPGRVAGLRRHPHRRPARRGRHARRAARRPAAGAGAGVRLHRADADVAARLRRPVPPPPRRAAAARRRGLRAGRSPPPGGWRSTGWPRGRRGPRSCWRRSPSSLRTRSRSPRWRRFEPGELELQEALRELLRLSLVDREADTVRVHRLVQDVVRARMTETARRDRLAAVARACVAQATDPRGRARRPRRPRRAPRRASPGTARRSAREPDGLVEALERVAARQAERALYPAAEHVLRAALRLHGAASGRRSRGPGPPDLRARSGARRRGPARARAGAAPRGGRAAGGDRRPGRPSRCAVLAHAHNRLGHVLNCADDAPAAIVAHRRALDVLHRAGRADLEPEVLIDLGYTLWGSGALDAAGEALRSGRAMLEEQGRRDERGWAHATAGSAWSSRTPAGWTRRSRTSVRRSRPSPGSAARTTPTPPRRSTSSATPCACRAASTRPSTRTGAASGLLERVLGPDDSRVGDGADEPGPGAGRRRELADQAVAVQTRAREIFTRTLGDTHSSTLLAGDRLADALAAAGQPVRARDGPGRGRRAPPNGPTSEEPARSS